MVQDFGLSKDSEELLGSSIKENNLLDGGTTLYWYQTYTVKTNDSLEFCCVIGGLLQKFGMEYNMYKIGDFLQIL